MHITIYQLKFLKLSYLFPIFIVWITVCHYNDAEEEPYYKHHDHSYKYYSHDLFDVKYNVSPTVYVFAGANTTECPILYTPLFILVEILYL